VIGTGHGLPDTPDAVRTGCIAVKYDPDGNLLWVHGTAREQDRIETAIQAKVSEDGEVVTCGTALDQSGARVCRVVSRDRNGLPHWSDDLGGLTNYCGPSAVDVAPNGVSLCGGMQRRCCDAEFCALRFDNNGRQIWSKFLYPPIIRGHARAMVVGQDSVTVVGQAGDGSANHLVVVRYEP
jgi:uncharacterized protein YuzE